MTWEAIEFVGERLLKIKLLWTTPAAISSNTIQDTIVMHFRNQTNQTWSSGVKKHLHESSMTMRSKVRKQLKQTPITKAAMESGVLAGRILQTSIVVVFILNMIVNGKGLVYLMWYLRAMQIILHLPML